jgi:hypothetical protein
MYGRVIGIPTKKETMMRVDIRDISLHAAGFLLAISATMGSQSAFAQGKLDCGLSNGKKPQASRSPSVPWWEKQDPMISVPPPSRQQHTFGV